ncbi:MAG: class I SAM-dependent methyltransferase [Thermodesulfobacteriota bacterium]|nr:class I SAM-dependent methyltransferase [Thermodesulfobacteriota bacterium]
MNTLDRQTGFWDQRATDKVFTHPLNREWFANHVNRSAAVLDVGCGYGRLLAVLNEAGYTNTVGVDISPAMIERGKALYPEADLRVWEGDALPFGTDRFDGVLLVAVLNCIPTNTGQQLLISEIHRVLKPGGVLFISDYPLQKDERNVKRYQKYQSIYGRYGTFEVSDGAVFRHHTMEWIADLLSPFTQLAFHHINVSTMNGHPVRAFQYLGKK